MNYSWNIYKGVFLKAMKSPWTIFVISFSLLINYYIGVAGFIDTSVGTVLSISMLITLPLVVLLGSVYYMKPLLTSMAIKNILLNVGNENKRNNYIAYNVFVFVWSLFILFSSMILLLILNAIVFKINMNFGASDIQAVLLTILVTLSLTITTVFLAYISNTYVKASFIIPVIFTAITFKTMSPDNLAGQDNSAVDQTRKLEYDIENNEAVLISRYSPQFKYDGDVVTSRFYNYERYKEHYYHRIHVNNSKQTSQYFADVTQAFALEEVSVNGKTYKLNKRKINVKPREFKNSQSFGKFTPFNMNVISGKSSLFNSTHLWNSRNPEPGINIINNFIVEKEHFAPYSMNYDLDNYGFGNVNTIPNGGTLNISVTSNYFTLDWLNFTVSLAWIALLAAFGGYVYDKKR